MYKRQVIDFDLFDLSGTHIGTVLQNRYPVADFFDFFHLMADINNTLAFRL